MLQPRRCAKQPPGSNPSWGKAGGHVTSFDGHAYLRRFFDRQYALAEPDLQRLLEKLCDNAGIKEGPFSYFPISTPMKEGRKVPLPRLLSIYMSGYGFQARSAFELVDILQTCAALCGQGASIHLPYLLPLIFGHMKGRPTGTLIKQKPNFQYLAYIEFDHFERNGRDVSFAELAELYRTATLMDQNSLSAAMNQDAPPVAVRAVYHGRDTYGPTENIWAVDNYPKLITTVARFKNPNLPT